MKSAAALQRASSKAKSYLAREQKIRMREEQDMWCSPGVAQGGYLADFKGVCENKYADEDSSSDALSSNSSTNTSSSTLSEEDEYMEEVNAASAYLHQITQQALDLLDDMETDVRLPKSSRPRYPSSFSQMSNGNSDFYRYPSRTSKDPNKPKKVKKSKSSRRRSSSQNVDTPSFTHLQPYGNVPRHSFTSLQMKTHDIVESAQDLLESIERDSLGSQFAQQQISDALQQHRLEYHRRRALTLQQQQKQQQQQIIHLQQSILQQRRQIKRSRKYSKHSRLGRSSLVCGRLSPIPEVHTPASSVTHDYD